MLLLWLLLLWLLRILFQWLLLCLLLNLLRLLFQWLLLWFLLLIRQQKPFFSAKLAPSTCPLASICSRCTLHR